MAWAHEGKGNRNPVAVVNGKKGLAPIVINARGGESIALDASQSTDPDGDKINVNWSLLPEAGNADVEGVVIADSDSPKTEPYIARARQRQPTECTVHGNRQRHSRADILSTDNHRHRVATGPQSAGL